MEVEQANRQRNEKVNRIKFNVSPTLSSSLQVVVLGRRCLEKRDRRERHEPKNSQPEQHYPPRMMGRQDEIEFVNKHFPNQTTTKGK